jgi:dTMP kinase
MTPGFFLTFEGVEGSGKSTQIRHLASHLERLGRQVVLTKEPGGTPLGDRIRAILLDPDESGMDPWAELFLYAASRRQHVVDVIGPALERGAAVLCDRYTDATLAYQGYGRLLQLDRLTALNEWATSGVSPDLTVVLDLEEEEGLARARRRNEESAALRREGRFEAENLRFHRRVREGYLALAQQAPERYAVVDGAGSEDAVFARLLGALAGRAKELLAS